MIKNDRQYKITNSQLRKFEEALERLHNEPELESDLHPLLREANMNALASQVEELRELLLEYEHLKSGECSILELESLEELPIALIKGRISAKLSQKELADKLGLKEQQIQRYEETNYSAASLTKLIEISKVLNISIHEDVYLPSANISFKALFSRLNELGIKKELILNNLVSKPLEAIIKSISDSETFEAKKYIFEVAKVIEKVFKLPVKDIFTNKPLILNTAVLGATRFKVRAGIDMKKIEAYTVFAHYLALLMVSVTKDFPVLPIPSKWLEFRNEVIIRYGELTFENTLNYVWDLGIPVLPLGDKGTFHGAFWRVNGRNVIVLKQKTKSSARWLFDLLHEVYHATQEPEQTERTIIESSDELLKIEKDEEEIRAMSFSIQTMLNGKANTASKKVMEKTSRNSSTAFLPAFKRIIEEVALEEKIPVDFLSNHIAFRIEKNHNLWGVANNLQSTDSDPRFIATKVLLERCNFDKLNAPDRNLLLRALETE